MYLALESLLDRTSFASQAFFVLLTSHNIQMTGWLHFTNLHTHTLIILLSLKRHRWTLTHKNLGTKNQKKKNKKNKKQSWVDFQFIVHQKMTKTCIRSFPLHQGTTFLEDSKLSFFFHLIIAVLVFFFCLKTTFQEHNLFSCWDMMVMHNICHT